MKSFSVAFVLTALLFVGPAYADTFTGSGSWGNAGNWSEGRPHLGTPVLIPAGKSAVLKANAQAGSIVVEGELSGCCTIETNGSVSFSHPLAWHGAVNSVGVDQLRLGGTTLETVNVQGIVSLREPITLTAGMIWHGSLDTNGYAMNVKGITYPLEESYSDYSTSTVTTDEWLDYPHEPSEDVWEEQFSEHATVIVNRSAPCTFKGAEWYYGRVDLACGTSVFSGDSYRTDLLELNSPEVRVEAGQTITTDVLTSNATAEHPVRVSAGHILTGEGGEATIDCGGCAVPAYVELVGVKVE